MKQEFKILRIIGEDEKVYFFEPLEKEISIEDMQKIVNVNEKLIKELKDVELLRKQK